MTDTVRIGVIGAGNMGQTHIKSIVEGKVPGMVVGAAADLLEERRKWAQSVLPAGTPVFNDGSELIKSGKVNAILIAVPHYQHPPLAIEAFKNNIHVMCEKPAGVYTKQVREMNEAAAASGNLIFGMMFNQRTSHIFRKMHEIVTGGSLGAIKRVSWIVTDWYRPQVYYDSGAWRATWDGEGGGVLLNQCPHNFDLLQWICGMPNRVRAFCHNGKWHNIEVEDDVTAYFEYPNGATGVFVTSTADAPGTNRFEVTMEKGKVICEDYRYIKLFRLKISEREFVNTAKGSFDNPPFDEEEVATDGMNEQHVGVLKAFTGAILRGEPLVADGAEGIKGLTLSNAMHLSSWLHKTIDLPIDEELFLNELNMRRAQSKAKTANDKVSDTSKSYGGSR